MEDPNSDGWLPPGWTVEVRVRKNGKRDKYYFSPSSGLKFNSKVELFRHLDNAQNNKVSIQRISDNVVVEKGIAEGLPPGWMKKTRITTKGDTIRRDSYYIDPLSGYVFRSIKDVDRYLESGEIGRNAFKPKVKDSSDKELKANIMSSPGVTAKPTLSVSLGQSSGLNMITNDQQIPRLASSGEYMSVPISKHILSQCFTNEDAQEKQLQVNSETKHGTEKAQSQNHLHIHKHKKEINLPRRASKRLAGIKVDPLPELKTRNRARRAAVKQSGEEETTNADKSPNSLPNDLAKQFNAVDGSETKCKSDSNGTEHTLNHATVKVLENGDKFDAKLDYTLDLPLKELLTDPCIAFAIQTLTGVTFETSENTQISSEFKNSQHSETAAAAEGKKINVPGYDSEGCNVFSSPENFAIPQEQAGVAQIDDKANANENAMSSSEKTLDEMSWMDPCIEFAIKTLTGTIPLDSDQNHKTCLQQLSSSSNTQQSEMALSSVSLGNSCQNDYYCSQYFGTQKSMFKQSFVDPTLQHTRNIGIANSGGTRLPHCGGN